MSAVLESVFCFAAQQGVAEREEGTTDAAPGDDGGGRAYQGDHGRHARRGQAQQPRPERSRRPRKILSLILRFSVCVSLQLTLVHVQCRFYKTPK